MHGNDGRFEKYDMMVSQTADPFENTNNCRIFTQWSRFEIPSLNNNPSTYNGWLWVSSNHGGGGGRGAGRAGRWRIPAAANELRWRWRGLSTPPNVTKIITYTSHAQTSSQHLAWIPLDSSCMRTFAKHPLPIVRKSKLAKTQFCEKWWKAYQKYLRMSKKQVI